MVLVLKNQEMEQLFPYRELLRQLIGRMEVAFREYGSELAVNRPRSRMYVPTGEPNTFYWFNNIAGIVPAFRAMALRIDSSLAREVVREGKRREEYPRDFVGLILLFDTETCELLSIMDDHFRDQRLGEPICGSPGLPGNGPVRRGRAGPRAGCGVFARPSVGENQSLQPQRGAPQKLRGPHRGRLRMRGDPGGKPRGSDPRLRHHQLRHEFERSGL